MPSDSPVPERPRQVTLAGWLIVIGSVLVVASAFERMSGLHSLETQEAIADFLSQPPGEGLGLSVDGAQSILRVLSLVAGAAAAAAAILGYQVLQRSRSARLWLTVLALPLLVGGMAVFGFLATLVVVSVLMLWLQPAKDWFNGVTPARPTQQPAVSGGAPQPPSPQAPPPIVNWPAPPPPPRRPAAVTAACIVTWVSCGLALGLMALTVLVLLAAPDMVFDEVRRQEPDFDQGGLTEGEVRQAAFVGSAIASLWCLAAIGFAIAAFQGLRWGWLALLVSAGAAGAASAAVMLGSVVLVLPLAAAAVTVGLLIRPESRTWCRRTTRRRGSVSP
jgi:hypothetical protein